VLETAAFTQPVGEVGPVLEADYGFHILKVDARTDAGLRPFADVRSDVETKVRAERYPVEYAAFMKKAWSEATIWIAPKYQDRLSPADTSAPADAMPTDGAEN
jgi:parvulin-like peptidyl-prolyl isomerase